MTMFVAMATSLLLAHQAEPPVSDGLGDSGYVLVSPGLFAIPLDDDDDEPDDNVGSALDLSYQWSLGAGYIAAPAPGVMIGGGLTFEHMVGNLEDSGFSVPGLNADWSAHAFRILPEIRLGGGIPQLFGYARIAPGMALIHTKAVTTLLGSTTETDDTDAGFNLGLSGGVMGNPISGLIVGMELGGDLSFMGEDENDDDIIFTDDGSYALYTFHIKVLLGWSF